MDGYVNPRPTPARSPWATSSPATPTTQPLPPTLRNPGEAVPADAPNKVRFPPRRLQERRLEDQGRAHPAASVAEPAARPPQQPPRRQPPAQLSRLDRFMAESDSTIILVHRDNAVILSEASQGCSCEAQSKDPEKLHAARNLGTFRRATVPLSLAVARYAHRLGAQRGRPRDLIDGALGVMLER